MRRILLVGSVLISLLGCGSEDNASTTKLQPVVTSTSAQSPVCTFSAAPSTALINTRITITGTASVTTGPYEVSPLTAPTDATILSDLHSVSGAAFKASLSFSQPGTKFLYATIADGAGNIALCSTSVVVTGTPALACSLTVTPSPQTVGPLTYFIYNVAASVPDAVNPRLVSVSVDSATYVAQLQSPLQSAIAFFNRQPLQPKAKKVTIRGAVIDDNGRSASCSLNTTVWAY